MKIQHPAKFSASIIEAATPYLVGYSPVLDMFAGVGGVFKILDFGYDGTEDDIVAIELEPEWASCHPRVVTGNALCTGLPDNFASAIFTSPTYGNRMADSFVPGEGWKKEQKLRNTYTHKIGRKLSDDNSGAMQWGKRYRRFHEKAWAEAARVFSKESGGPFVLNTSNHVRDGVEQPVTQWHISVLCDLGFAVERELRVKTRRNGFGANRDVRVGFESVHILRWR